MFERRYASKSCRPRMRLPRLEMKWPYHFATSRPSLSSQAPRCAEADQLTHHEPEIEATRMNQQSLQDVRVAAQMGAAHAARVVEMREGAFDLLAALAHQSASAWSA